jgi:2-isopropylmalate synthase
MRPESVGLHATKFVLGKHSGRHAFKTRLKELGYVLTDDELNKVFDRFKKLADQKKDIFDEDIEILISEDVTRVPEVYSLVDLYITSGFNQKPTAAIKLKVREEIIHRLEQGDGPVDATYKAIESISHTQSRLLKFEVKSITGGTDAMGEVVVSLEEDSRTVRGYGADTDIIVAAAKAYINALNKLAARKKQQG